MEYDDILGTHLKIVLINIKITLMRKSLYFIFLINVHIL